MSAETHPSGQAPGAAQLLEDVRRVATAKGRATVDAFSVEGRRMLERAVRAGWMPRGVLVGESAHDPALFEPLAQRGCSCHVLPDERMLSLSEGRRSGLITALFPLPELPTLPALLGLRPAPAVFLVIVDVIEPGNVGALIRTALACDAAGAVCVGSTDPFHPKALRTSLGSLFKLPLVRLASSDGLIDALRARGVCTLATVARAGDAIDRANWPHGSVALLVGNEGAGLPERLRDAADGRITIDLSRAADSFCVNAAAAVCLYEVQRRLRFRA